MGMDDEMGGEETFGGDMEDGGEFAGDEMGMDDEMGGDMEMGGEEEIEDRVVDLEDAIDELKAEFDQLIGDDGMDDVEDFGADVASDEDEEDEEQTEESLVREYVEKVSAPSNTEGADQHQSIVAKSNRMGGTSANILGDQSEEKGAGKIATPKSLKGAGSFRNDPKAKAGKTSFKKKETAKKADAPENKKSLLDGPKGKKGK